MLQAEFSRYVSQGYTLIPITKKIEISNLNPIDIYSEIADKPNSYLFESLEENKKWSRYTIIGLPSKDYLTVKDNTIQIFKDNKIIQTIDNEDPFSWIENYYNQYKIPKLDLQPPFVGGLVGFFGFDSIKYIEKKIKPSNQTDQIDSHDIALIISKEVLVFDKNNNCVYIIVYSENSIESYHNTKNKIDKICNSLDKFESTNIQLNTKLTIKDEISYHFKENDFLKAVNKIKDYIRCGDVMQVVLSQRMSMLFDDNPLNFYRVLRKINPSPYMYYLNMLDCHIIGSSPEILVRLEDGEITVRPIAGTRPRGTNSSLDLELEQELKSDPKENAEHLMLIDLGRNDIGKVSEIGTVKLTEKMIIEKYSHVMHMVSNVKGKIKKDHTMFNVLKSTFPAGTVTGAPKIRAIEIIYELEKSKRGIYAGAIGYLGWNGNLDTAIAIRTSVIKDNVLNIQCGAGIVHDSIAEKEWEETINKGMAILQAYKNLKSIK